MSDLFVMGLALILESMVLGKWLENMGMGPVGLTGLSMGGYVSCMELKQKHESEYLSTLCRM